MNFRVLLILLLLTLNSVLFSETTKEEILSWEWFKLEIDDVNRDILINSLLELEQGKLLFQALFYQHQCLKGRFSIKVATTSSQPSQTNFTYNESAGLSAVITLKCTAEKKTSTIQRPILIIQNGFYRLYQIEVPAFIILAHELLHVLNHAELFSSDETELITFYLKTFSSPGNDIVFRRNALQKFLCKKLFLPIQHFILCSPYRDFWWNPYNMKNDLGDSLDEMTTILCSFHNTSPLMRVRIGETLLMREYYGKINKAYKNLISWTHIDTTERYAFEKNHILLDSNYVNTVLEIFPLIPESIKGEENKKQLKLVNTLEINDISTLDPSFIYGIKNKRKGKAEISLLIGGSMDHTPKYNFVDENFVFFKESFLTKSIIEFRGGKVKKLELSREEILSEVFPKTETFIMFPRKINFGSFGTLDVPSDGNCAFWAVLIASGSVTSSDAPGASAAMEDLRNKSADLAVAANVDPDFVNLLRTSGQWNAGIHGGVGLEALHYIARYLGRRIILIENEGNVFSYWNSRENNLVLHAIEAENIGKFLEDVKRNDKKAIFIYHEGSHFQAIVKK